MNLEKNSKWEKHHKLIEGKPPKPLLIKALTFVANQDAALDLGAGALVDSEYLVKEGFKSVTAIDIEPSVAKRKHSKKIEVIISSFEEMKLPTNKFDLVTSQFSLPFIHPDSFNDAIEKISSSLKKEGVFTGQLFGNNDEWKNNPKMTFHTKEEAEQLFSSFEIIQINEREHDGILANGQPKHWHLFHFIVRKK